MVLLATSGCGLGIHRNPSAAITAPYHEHQDTILDAPAVHRSAHASPMPGVGVGAFARYYAMPIGFQLGTGEGAAKSWGHGTVLTWSEVRPTVPPEQAVQTAFAKLVGASGPDGELVIRGVVTDLSWYVLEDGAGGRISTRVVVTRRDGSVVFEGERSTLGRASNLDELVDVHVERWLADAKLAAALKGGPR